MHLEWTHTQPTVKRSQAVNGYCVIVTRRDGTDDVYLMDASHNINTLAYSVDPSTAEQVAQVAFRTLVLTSPRDRLDKPHSTV